MKQDNPQISLILPAKGFPQVLSETLDALSNQTLMPQEVVIVDSSKKGEIDDVVLDFQDKINIKHIKVKKAYPGEARNLAIKESTNEILAFVDSKTVPETDWLEASFSQLSKNIDVIFGKTQYLASSQTQKILQATIYGSFPVETLPGTMLRKKTFYQIGEFIEQIRSSEDLEWRSRCRELDLEVYASEKVQMTYAQVSRSILSEIKKQFIYQLHGAYSDVQLRMKTIIFGLAMLFVALLIPQWNALVGWEGSILYIPNITKSFFYLISIFSMVLLIQNLFEKRISILFKFSIGVLFLISTYLVYQWNFVMADWVEESIFYIPHITKGYISLILFSAVIFRGIYKPLIMGIKRNYLFPFRWLLVGLVGIFLDLAKIPGYLLGAIIAIKNRLFNDNTYG